MAQKIEFIKLAQSGKARRGVLKTTRGDIQTPAFMPVGTAATVKAMMPESVAATGAEVLLGNTYHLMLRPGAERVANLGGLHKFMNWSGPILTDSGGFQVMSLSELRKLTEEGVKFKSHVDGAEFNLTPESSMEIQWNLGADMIFAFDECTSPLAPHWYQKEAMDRTHRWAQRSLDRHQQLDPDNIQALFGVVQGGRYQDLREESARVLGAMDFDGYGIGGSFNKDDMASAVAWVNAILPEEKPRHMLGIGEPMDIFNGVENGCDLFDCVSPTRVARHGRIYTPDGPINITNAKYKHDTTPFVEGYDSYPAKNYTKGYIHHLFKSKEMLGQILASIHNLHFIISLTDQIRESLYNDTFFEFKKEFMDRYYGEK